MSSEELRAGRELRKSFTAKAGLASWQTAASALSNSVTPPNVPDAPTSLVATPGNGSAITNYEYKLGHNLPPTDDTARSVKRTVTLKKTRSGVTA